MSEGAFYWFWCAVRDEAGIAADARLHDLRHSHASHAIMNGESLYMAGRLLGHRRASTTNCYAHLNVEGDCGAGCVGNRGETVPQLRVVNSSPPCCMGTSRNAIFRALSV